jgi:copper resistance protein C
MSRRHLLVPSLLAVLALAAMPALALGHAELDSATPAPDSTVEIAPAELVATFTEALDGSKSSLEVRDAAGSVVASGGAELLGADGITMTLPLPALGNGTYEVRWTSAATDGHIERGTFSFTVSAPSSSSPSPSPSPSPSAEPTASPSPSPSPSAIASPAATPTPSPTDSGADPGSEAGGLDAATLLPIALAWGAMIAACGPGDASAVGVVVSIDAATSLEVSGFTLRTGSGETMAFVVGPVELDSGAFPASHLREHLATSQPIAVAYRMEDGTRVAYRLVDAPWFTP